MEFTHDDESAVYQFQTYEPYRLLLQTHLSAQDPCGFPIDDEVQRFLKERIRWRGSARFVTRELQDFEQTLWSLVTTCRQEYGCFTLAAVKSGERMVLPDGKPSKLITELQGFADFNRNLFDNKLHLAKGESFVPRTDFLGTFKPNTRKSDLKGMMMCALGLLEISWTIADMIRGDDTVPPVHTFQPPPKGRVHPVFLTHISSDELGLTDSEEDVTTDDDDEDSIENLLIRPSPTSAA